MSNSLNLFQIAFRGVNTVTAPTHLTVDEVTAAQNAESSSIRGEGGLDQRPGMTRLNSTNLAGGAVLLVEDLPADCLFGKTPTLYAGMYTGSTHNWRKSIDGATWTNADTPAKPFSHNANIALYAKNYPKCASINGKMFFVDGATPIGLHAFDGTTDTTVAYVPPAVSGTTLSTPNAPTLVYNGVSAGSTTYTYKLVARAGANRSAASAAASVGAASTLDANNYIAITPPNPPVAGATSYDVYRTVGGATQGKIGSIPVTSGAFTTGNGSGLTGLPFPSGSASLNTSGTNTPNNGVSYSYALVAYNGTNHSGPLTVSTIGGPTTLAVSGDGISKGPLNIGIVTGPDSFTMTDMKLWRTAGGSSQGYLAVPFGGLPGGLTGVQDVGSSGDGTSPPASVVGLGGGPVNIFSDGALAGDSASAPSTASGASVGDAIGVLDLITDGVSLYLAVLDNASSDPTVYGRILQYSPDAGNWAQIGATFPTGSGNGSAAALTFYDGALVYGTYIGTTSGNNSYAASTQTPLPAGGIAAVRAVGVSLATCTAIQFNGDLFLGLVSLVAATAAFIQRHTPIATWSTAVTAGGGAVQNAYTSLGIFNGRLYAGWTSGDGSASAKIISTIDGSTWVTELTLDVAEVPCQMVVFGGALYIVCGKTGVAYNTLSRIIKRDTVGTWTTADDPVDDYAGCIGVVYV